MPLNLKKVRKSYPQMIFDPIRHDVLTYVEEQYPTLATRIDQIGVAKMKDGTGYDGVILTAKDKPLVFTMTGEGFQCTKPEDDWEARVRLQSLLDAEQAKSVEVRNHESTEDMDKLYFDFTKKALPHSKPEPGAKKAPASSKASSKKTGSGPLGKTRYNYPTEKGKPGAAPRIPQKKTKTPNAGGAEMQQKPPAQQLGNKPDPQTDVPEKEYVDPLKLASLLNMSLGVLKKVAQKFARNQNGANQGKKGFVNFMWSQCKKLSDKHDLTPKYFGLVYDSLVGPANPKPVKAEP